MKLIPNAVAKTIPPCTLKEEENPIAHARIFDPSTGWEWFIHQYDPEEQIAYCLANAVTVEYGTLYVPGLVKCGPVKLDPTFKPRPLRDIHTEIEEARVS
jgi:hypothetical protein